MRLEVKDGGVAHRPSFRYGDRGSLTSSAIHAPKGWFPGWMYIRPNASKILRDDAIGSS
jgi:hypothetical protein